MQTHVPASRVTADDLTIERIEVVPVRVPLGRVFQGSHYSMSTRCTIVTRVHTRNGLVSEVYNGDTDAEQSVIVGIINDEIVPQLIGRSALNIEGCWEAMLPPTYDILRDRSLALQAIACVDSALWDVLGKALGVPLFQLWGGYRDRLPSICIGGYYSDDEADVARQIERYRELGFAGCKFKVGGRSPEEDAARVRAARSAVGDDFVLTIDANQGFSLRQAVDFSRRVADQNIRWFEEPVRWFNDRIDMAGVRNMTGIPVCAGQSEIGRAGCRDLMMAGAIDVCNFDASWGAGPTEWRRVAGTAMSFGVEMGHHEEPQISAHLLASIAHATYLETFHPDRDPMFYALVANRSPFVNGQYKLPEGAGFALELDEKVIAKHRVS